MHCRQNKQKQGLTSGIFLTLVIVFLLASIDANAIELPVDSRVPGGVAIVTVGTADQPKPEIYFNGSRTMVQRQNKQWVTIVGLPLSLRPGKHTLSKFDAAGNNTAVPFTVKKKSYRTQYLRIKDKRKVEPNKKDLERIIHESKEIKSLFTLWTEKPPESILFEPPINGRQSDSFGSRRFFNNKPRRPHSGMDISAPQGTAVKAPASAIVIGTGDYFFTGNAVFLDHGYGLITMYIHLHKIDVAVGDAVVRGQKIGEVGKTGRATGPHLHWAVSLNNSRVNPALFLKTSKNLKNFKKTDSPSPN